MMSSPLPLAVTAVGDCDGEVDLGAREWMASEMASSEPWLTLGRGLDACRAAIAPQPGATLYIARPLEQQPPKPPQLPPSLGTPSPATGDTHAVPPAASARFASDAIAGGMLLRWKGMAGAPYIAALIVHASRSARGCGVGTALVATAEAESARAGAASLFLCVSDFNLGARRLYERLGFVAVGLLQDYVIPGAAEVIMHKRLPRQLAATPVPAGEEPVGPTPRVLGAPVADSSDRPVTGSS